MQGNRVRTHRVNMSRCVDTLAQAGEGLGGGSQTLMHAAKCPGRFSSKGGTMRRHSSLASGQRVLKTQPVGGARWLGNSPLIRRGARPFSTVGSGIGAASSRTLV